MFEVFLEACKDTYVRSCTPAPKTPASEVVVKTITDTLAATGGTTDPALVVTGILLALGGILLFIYNDLRKRDQKNPFKVGDRVYCKKPKNASWNPSYTATVTGVRGNLIDIRWDHGPSNSGHPASDFAIRS